MQTTKQDSKFCWICGKNIALDHCTRDERGLSIHASCHEKQIMMQAATREVELWRRNLARAKTA